MAWCSYPQSRSHCTTHSLHVHCPNRPSKKLNPSIHSFAPPDSIPRPQTHQPVYTRARLILTTHLPSGLQACHPLPQRHTDAFSDEHSNREPSISDQTLNERVDKHQYQSLSVFINREHAREFLQYIPRPTPPSGLPLSLSCPCHLPPSRRSLCLLLNSCILRLSSSLSALRYSSSLSFLSLSAFSARRAYSAYSRSWLEIRAACSGRSKESRDRGQEGPWASWLSWCSVKPW